ncbi:type II toxin-antitoxin system prevent-host-death family antitoxin [Roseibium sp. FZY0029]|uniref:type II toxin-antitoxin system Phd/YefM family antitoxin n=1 Tax=Roseibium sp. FZY0029 TaxID=3116647 RepID=UPI002ECB2964|nr:type II toxin-antitoxin system prevent-host-death family antitoxin [Roseibium sp. FZY0029]
MTDRTTYTASEARSKFSDIFNEALYGKPVVINKHGKQVAVVSLALLDRLAELEAYVDSLDAQKALEEFHSQGGTSMADLEKELGLD